MALEQVKKRYKAVRFYPYIISISINNSLQEFIDELRSNGENEEKINKYCKAVKKFLKVCGYTGEELTNRIDLNVVNQWIRCMYSLGYETSTINRYIRSLKEFFYWCMDHDGKYIINRFRLDLLKHKGD